MSPRPSKTRSHEVNLAAVWNIYEGKPLTDEIVKALNAGVSKEDLKSDVEEIGYHDDNLTNLRIRAGRSPTP